MKYLLKSFILLSFTVFQINLLIAQNPIWTNLGPGAGSDLHYLTIQNNNSDVIYTAGDIEGIFKSTDGGLTWANINNNLAQLPYGADVYWINEIKIDPLNPQNIFICDGVGLFGSINGGDQWQLLFPDSIDDEDYPPMETSALAIDPVNTSRLFLGLGDEAGECSFADFLPFPGFDGSWGVYRSIDDGQSWIPISSGLPDSVSVHTIDLIPSTNKLVIATNRGVYRSDDGGENWMPKNQGLPHHNAYRIKPDNSNGNYILTLTMRTIGDVEDSTTFAGGIFRSNDLGDTWYDISGNLPTYDPYANLFYDYWKFDTYPGDINTIYIATNPGSGYEETGIFTTHDGGINWELLYTPEIGGWMDTAFIWEGYAYDIRISSSDPAKIAICRDDVEISNDTGNIWHNAFTTPLGQGWKGNGLELMNTESIAFDPFDSSRFYVGYDDFGLFRSDDAGNSFIRLDAHQDPEIGNISDVDAVKDIYIDPASGDLYIERYQGSQGGQSAGFTSGGLLFSSDHGNQVTDITGTLPKNGRYDVAVDFSSGTPGHRVLYAAIYHHGVYKSVNGGMSWIAINTGLSSKASYCWDIIINPDNPQELYLGINSWGQDVNGLFKSVNGGQDWSPVNGLPAGDIGLIYMPDSHEIFAGVSDNFDWSTNGGLYRSTDMGLTWEIILNHPRVVDMQVNPENDSVIMAVGQQWYNVTPGIGHGIYISKDNGSSWELITEQGINNTLINFARFNPYHPEMVFACSAGGGLWKSTLILPLGNTERENTRQPGLQVYPNPFKSQITIDLGFSPPKAEATILNAVGKEMANAFSNYKQKLDFNLSGLDTGIYFIKIKTMGTTYLIKTIKE